MPLRILHVLSSNFFAGSVAYALQLAEHQNAGDHKVFIVTDQAGLSDKITCLPLPISDRSLLQRFRNIRYLKKLMREQQIDVVHAHSRAASWVAHYAVRGTRVPLVSTIHGRQVKHSSLKSNDIYGEKAIAICPQLIEQLANQLGMDRQKLVCLPNPLDLERLKQFNRTRASDGNIVISVVGRLNGPKGAHIADLVSQVFPQLLLQNPTLSIQIVGGEWDSFPQKGKDAFADLQSKYGQRIQYIGFTKQVMELMSDSDVVIGAGRVAMEALALKTAVFAMGEACCHGFVTRANLSEAISTNFGDILSIAVPFQPDTDNITKELQSFVDGKPLTDVDLSELARTYDINRIMPEILRTYSSVIMRKLSPAPIPVLMYHRVSDAVIKTRHRTFVTKENFEKHLRFFKQRGLTAITFKDYLAFSTGEKPLNTFPEKPFIITFDDGYLDNFRNMLPLTEKYGFKGVLFLLGDFKASGNFWDEGEDVEANRLMTTEQKQAFVDHGWEIGAHTMTHPRLTQLNTEEARLEIIRSRECIEQELRTQVISFAYPFGNYDDDVKDLVKQAGFDFGIATDNGGYTIEDDRLAIFRVNMFPEESMFSLFKKTSSWYRKYYQWKRGK